MALSSEAGWNQTVPDWRFMLGAGEARGQLTAAGALVASALILPYDDRIAWIAMLLTTESHRRRGLATANLRWAIERCAARGLIAGLDATPAGREFYAPLGFTDSVGPAAAACRAAGKLPEPSAPLVVRPMRQDDLLPSPPWMPRRSAPPAPRCWRTCAAAGRAAPGSRTSGAAGLAGFVLGRPGRATLHIGPLIARDADVATALAARALAQAAASEPIPVSIDVPDGQQAFRQRLTQAGFAPLRPFTRMLRAAAWLPPSPI